MFTKITVDKMLNKTINMAATNIRLYPSLVSK